MITSFNQWWQRPLRTRDKIGAVFIGAIGGFWISLLGRLMLGQMPVSFSVLLYWAIGGIIIGIILGALFPRTVSVLLYPFALLGIGGG